MNKHRAKNMVNRATRSKFSHSEGCKELLLQPWFLPSRVTYKLHGIMPPFFWNKMRNYFEDWGCIVCGSEGRYHSNGMCVRCYVKIINRLKQSMRRRSKSRRNQRLDLELFRQEKLAKKLLSNLRDSNQEHRSNRMRDIYRPYNPVYEVFGRHRE